MGLFLIHLRMKVCVIGASGQVGRPLMDELLKLGHEVRAVTRSSNSQYEAMQQRGVDVRVIDITSEQETTDAFQSCDVVISVVRADSETIEKLQPIWLKSAVQANVSRFVPTEYGCHTRAANFGDCVLLDCKKRFQEKLLSSGIQWTLIYPGGFHDYFLPNLRYWDKITTFGDLDIPIYTHAVDDIGRIIARIITDSRTVNKCVQLDYYSLTQNKMLQLLKEYYPDANFEYEHYSPEKILELRESSGDSITAKKGAESDRERWGLNYVIYVLGKLACFTEETLRASELYPDYNPKKPEESLSDKEFVFGKQ